jgi:hypothetical protein
MKIPFNKSTLYSNYKEMIKLEDEEEETPLVIEKVC